MADRLYYMGLLKDYKNPDHIILEMRGDLDCLSCEIMEYLGARLTTKKHIKENKADILAWFNDAYHTNFKRMTID